VDSYLFLERGNVPIKRGSGMLIYSGRGRFCRVANLETHFAIFASLRIIKFWLFLPTPRTGTGWERRRYVWPSARTIVPQACLFYALADNRKYPSLCALLCRSVYISLFSLNSCFLDKQLIRSISMLDRSFFTNSIYVDY